MAYGTRISDLTPTTEVEADDYLPIVSQVRQTNGTRRILAPDLLKGGGKTLIVDVTSGSDTHGRRGSLMAFASMSAARTAAQSGDLIVVCAGTYSLTTEELSKNGVNWHFMPGAFVVRDMTDPSIKNGSTLVPALFDDNGDAMEFVVTGWGEFHFDYGENDWEEDGGIPVLINSNVNRFGLLQIDNEDSSVYFQARRCTYEGYGNAGVHMVYVHNCARVEISMPEMVSINPTATTEIAQEHEFGPLQISDVFGGIWWAEGETFINIGHIKSGLYTLYPEGTGITNPTNFWVKSTLIESWGLATIYCNGIANANWRVWIEADEIRGVGIDPLHIQCNGKIYIVAKKIGSTVAGIGYAIALSAIGLEFWLTVQKISGLPAAGEPVLRIGNSVNAFPVKAWLSVQHWEDIHATPSSRTPAAFILQTTGAGTSYIQGGVMVCSQNCWGIKHDNGTTVATKVRVECNGSNDVDNIPAVAAASGLILDGCTLLAPALADSVYAASAQNVKVYGTTFTNKAKNANVTIQVGTLTVDANVT